MLVIKCPALSSKKYDKLLADLTAQAKSGVVLLEPYLELLNEVPADEEIKVVQGTPAGKDVAMIPAAEWWEAMEYIRALHDCATCKHETDGRVCLDADCDCTACAERASCACANCHNGSGWEWRYGHGKG